MAKPRVPYAERQGANMQTVHHVLFQKERWESAGKAYNDVRNLGSFLINLRRDHHDFLHMSVSPTPPPHRHVLDYLRDVGREVKDIHNPIERLTQIAAEMGHFAIASPSALHAQEGLILANNLSAQAVVIDQTQAWLRRT